MKNFILYYNITARQKDSLQINDPNLIESLPAGLYDIEKIYDDGDTDHVIIQKNN